MKGHLVPVRMARVRAILTASEERKQVQPRGNQHPPSKQLNIELPSDPAVPLLGVHRTGCSLLTTELPARL